MMKFLKYTAYTLVLIGALNWGLVGLFGFNLVAAILGDMTILARIVYTLVGAGAVVSALSMYRCGEREHRSNCEYGTCRL